VRFNASSVGLMAVIDAYPLHCGKVNFIGSGLESERTTEASGPADDANRE